VVIEMPVTLPIVALVALVALSLVARELKYALTSASLMVVTGALATWLAAVYLLGV
jgi:hypothetical protein